MDALSIGGRLAELVDDVATMQRGTLRAACAHAWVGPPVEAWHHPL